MINGRKENDRKGKSNLAASESNDESQNESRPPARPRHKALVLRKPTQIGDQMLQTIKNKK